MREPDDFKDILIRELVSVPSYLWGGFFPIHLAIWRFLKKTDPDLFGPVVAFKRSRVPKFPYSLRIEGDRYELTRHSEPADEISDVYTFSGPSADRLAEILWSEGELADLVEQLAYYLSDNTNRDAFLSGSVAEEDLPPLDIVLMQRIAEEARHIGATLRMKGSGCQALET